MHRDGKWRLLDVAKTDQCRLYSSPDMTDEPLSNTWNEDP